METKVSKKSKPTKTLGNVVVEVADSENKSIADFFQFRGMKKAFFEEYPGNGRHILDRSISNGYYRVQLLKDVRQFIEDHKEEVAEFLHSDTAAA